MMFFLKLLLMMVKLDEETAPGWSERVVYELAKALSLLLKKLLANLTPIKN